MSHRVLIIEDNPQNLELATDLLELAGFTVIGAASAAEGIRLASEASPDIILMDVALPDMDGLAAVGHIKRKSEMRRIPVVALTAHAMSGDEERALAAGCDGYITKPIDTRTFSTTILGFVRKGT